jgi:polyisoprenoid-binding protein YceI
MRVKRRASSCILDSANICPKLALFSTVMVRTPSLAMPLAVLVVSLTVAASCYGLDSPETSHPRGTVYGEVAAADVAGTYRVDLRHSTLKFSVRHFPFSTVAGSFSRYEAGFTIPSHSLEDTRVNVAIWPESVDTGTAEIDRLLVGGRFFDVAHHPKIRFESTGVEIQAEGSALLTGDLTLLGVTKKVSFDVVYAFAPFDRDTEERRVSFSASVTISRSEFGMDQLSSVVDDAVTISLTAEAQREKPATGPSSSSRSAGPRSRTTGPSKLQTFSTLDPALHPFAPPLLD